MGQDSWLWEARFFKVVKRQYCRGENYGGETGAQQNKSTDLKKI
jgi:hypothetical protein